MVLDLTLLSPITDQNCAAHIVISQSYKEIETIEKQRATLLLQISREIIFTIKIDLEHLIFYGLCVRHCPKMKGSQELLIFILYWMNTNRLVQVLFQF